MLDGWEHFDGILKRVTASVACPDGLLSENSQLPHADECLWPIIECALL